MKKIVILMAMEPEASPLIAKLALTKNCEDLGASLPLERYTGEYNGIQLDVVLSGKCDLYAVDMVGTLPATLATYLAIDKLNPDYIINAGTAGGFIRKGAAIGDVYLANATAFHDRRIPIPGFTEYGVNKRSINIKKMATELGYKTGLISTGNSLDICEMDKVKIQQNDASLKDMEAAAIHWVAAQYKRQVIFLKSVTDLVDGQHPSHEEFLVNLNTASHNLRFEILRVLNYLK